MLTDGPVNCFVDAPWTWRDRLRFRLFPSRVCSLPEAPASYKDCVVTTTHVQFDWLDRIRVVLTGHVVVQTRTVAENIVGGTRTSSVAYPSRKGHHD